MDSSTRTPVRPRRFPLESVGRGSADSEEIEGNILCSDSSVHPPPPPPPPPPPGSQHGNYSSAAAGTPLTIRHRTPMTPGGVPSATFGSTSGPPIRRRMLYGSSGVGGGGRQQQQQSFRSPSGRSLGGRSVVSQESQESQVTQYEQYGNTPSFLKYARRARVDIGDAGRQFVVSEALRRRLPAIEEQNLDQVRELFENFFHDFRLSNYQDQLDLTDGDLLDELRIERDETFGLGYYQKKLATLTEQDLDEMPEVDIPMMMADTEGDSSLGRVGRVKCFDISLTHVKLMNPFLYYLIIQHPADCISEVDLFVADEYKALRHELCPDFGSSHDTIGGVSSSSAAAAAAIDAPRVLFYDKPEMSLIRSLEPPDLETLICLRGIVIRCSELIPEMTMATFRCTNRVVRTDSGQRVDCRCGNIRFEHLLQGEVEEPKECDVCNGKQCFELWHNMCQFASKQLVKITELADNIPQGETPQSISAYVYDEMIDHVKPGDRVEVAGIYKASGVRVHPRLRNLRSVFRTYINVLHIKKEGKQKMKVAEREMEGRAAKVRDEECGGFIDEEVGGARISELLFSSELVKKLEELSKDSDIYNKLTESLAPSIYKRDDIKKGLLCQLLGGSGKTSKNHGAFRKELHILLCGDPSTAKSQLLHYVHKLAPRGVYTSGKGSSSVGLTAFVSKDPDTKEAILESGAVVLSDRGICCIDEFDKMEEGARAILHEVMEQQTVTVAKAGIVATLNARTAILASANPINSRYDRRRAVVENINLPPSLFSRFDLIYLILDQADAEEDRLLAQMLCRNFTMNDGEAQVKPPPIDADTLAQYISYARANCDPIISTNAGELLVSEYLKMRREGGDSKAVTASPRQLEGLIRISQALAKMRLEKFVSCDDVKEAVRLMTVATYQSLIDPISGRIDFDQVNLGQTVFQRFVVEQLQERIREVVKNEENLNKEEIFNRLKENTVHTGKGNDEYESEKGGVIDRKEFEEAMHLLENDREISRTAKGTFKFTTVI